MILLTLKPTMQKAIVCYCDSVELFASAPDDCGADACDIFVQTDLGYCHLSVRHGLSIAAAP